MDLYSSGADTPCLIQYVELGGILGLFVKLDLALVDEIALESFFHTFQHQVRVLVREERKGGAGYLHKETYVRSTERILKKGRFSQCRYCDQVFHCRADLTAHHSRLHSSLPLKPGKKGRKPCPQCGKLVVDLNLHIQNKHGPDTVVNTAPGLTQCRQCGESYLLTTDHASTCRFSPVCPECKKTFSQWRVMNKHRRVVHMGMKISCSSCDNSYHDAQSLKKHVEAVHLKIKKMCPLCGVTVSSLAVHMNAVHTGNKNFACTECEKKFKSNYDLSRHRDLVHLGAKPPCPICGKHLANMRQHIRVVHKQIRFPCHLCKKLMTTKSELRKHVSKSHPDMTAAGPPPIQQQQQQHNQQQQQQQQHHQQQQQEQHQQHAQYTDHEEKFTLHDGLKQVDPLGPEDQFDLQLQGQKDLSDDQLLFAEYLGKQNFSLNMIKSHEGLTDLSVIKDDVIIKPDLENLIGGVGRSQSVNLLMNRTSTLANSHHQQSVQQQQQQQQQYNIQNRHNHQLIQAVKSTIDIDSLLPPPSTSSSSRLVPLSPPSSPFLQTSRVPNLYLQSATPASTASSSSSSLPTSAPLSLIAQDQQPTSHHHHQQQQQQQQHSHHAHHQHHLHLQQQQQQQEQQQQQMQQLQPWVLATSISQDDLNRSLEKQKQ